MRDLQELEIEPDDDVNGHPRPAPSPQAIQAFEKQFGVVLPEDYLQLLRFSNGGYPEKGSFIPADPEDDQGWEVAKFLPLSEDPKEPYTLWAAMAEWCRVLGEQIIPFAENGFGDVLFIDMTTGAVFGAWHEFDFDRSELAPSFGAFIDGLGLDPDLEEELREEREREEKEKQKEKKEK